MSDIDVDHVRRLDGRLLLVFRALLRRRSVTAAAAELHLSQSAVSHALGRLRTIHGDPLFTRRPHGLEPTRRAEELGPIVDELIELAGRLRGDAAGWDPTTSDRRFEVAAPEFVVTVVGAELLGRWASSAPGVSLVTHQLGHEEVVRRLTRGDLDVAVGRFRDRQPAALRRELLYADDYCVVAAADHPALGEGLDLDLDRYRTLGHVIAGTASEGDEYETIPAGLRVRAVVSGWLTALAVAAAGDAVVTCPRRLALHHAPRLGLRIFDLPGRPIPIEVSLLTRRDDAPAPALAWLIDELRAVVAA